MMSFDFLRFIKKKLILPKIKKIFMNGKNTCKAIKAEKISITLSA